MRLHRCEKVLRDADGGQGVLAAARRLACPSAGDEFLQLARQLILGLAVQGEKLKMAGEQFFANASSARRIQSSGIQALFAHGLRWLQQRDLALAEVDVGVAFRPQICMSRCGIGLARLAVTSARQPFSKCRRALAMSSCGPKMLRPTASTERTGECDQGQHQIEIVNHQIEDDADVGRSAR